MRAPEIYALARTVRLLVLDVDGVLTDGRLYYADDAVELKAFNIQDGLGLRMLSASGVGTAIISGRRSKAVELRAENLDIKHVFQGVSDKLSVFEQLLSRLHVAPEHAAGIGDDLPDLPVLRRCGLAVCVPEAPALVQQHVHYVTQHAGGRGAVRELCEMIMTAQGSLEDRLREFMR
jgi:3-deoxy-D-manno-octulosonate 8-phosphate phosphatase (KDO 8-P phosphatase)